MDGNIFLIKMIEDRPVIWMKNYISKCGEVRRMHYYEEIATTIGTNTNWIISRWNMLKKRFFKEYRRTKLKKNENIRFKYFKNMLFLTNNLLVRSVPDFNTTTQLKKNLNLCQFNSSKDNLEFVLEETLLKNWSPNNNYFVFNDQNSSNNTYISDNNCEVVKNVVHDKKQTKEILDTDNKNRCEDNIFGELVTVMLKEMPAEKKKQIKKQIMNIMLS